ncbi:TPA: hypothetical protein BOS_25794 [Bos taurus]|nr:TPA: hypothetical protein BOS_25794 [Bos taurus]
MRNQSFGTSSSLLHPSDAPGSADEFGSPCPSPYTFQVKGISPERFQQFPSCGADVTSTADLGPGKRLEAESESRRAGAFRKQPPQLPSARNVSRAAPS